MEQEKLEYYNGLFEAILFLSPTPVKLKQLVEHSELAAVDAEIIIQTLVDDYADRETGLMIREVAGGYQMMANSKYHETLQNVFQPAKKETLTRAGLETLAIIAYKQPITIPEIEEVRGANSRNLVFQLLKKNLIKGNGKKEVPGHPTLYVTTVSFLEKLGLNSLADLPTLTEIKDLHFEALE